MVSAALCAEPTGAPNNQLEQLPKPEHCVFSGEFEQAKMLPGLEAPISSQGRFLHHCGHGIIWQTVTPVASSLIVDARHNAYQIKQGAAERVSGRAGKMIAQIISSLMGGDEGFILDNFSLTAHSILGEPFVIELKPVSKQLKRAIETIQLFPPGNHDPAMKIVLRDRNAQTTTITALEKNHYTTALSNGDCRTEAGFGELECDRLFAAQPD
jgi:hypothetical protein